MAARSALGNQVLPDLLTPQLYHLVDLLELMIRGADRGVIGPQGIDQFSALDGEVAPGLLQTVYV